MAAKKKAKKPVKVVIHDVDVFAEIVNVKAPDIALLPTDFGREDLNQMAAKINEIIAKMHG